MKIRQASWLFIYLNFVVTSGQLIDSSLLRHVVDVGFETFDLDPKDGFITPLEVNDSFAGYDLNGDGCISETEFEHENHLPIPHVVTIFYHYFDKANPDCISVSSIADSWHILDTTGDGKLSLLEFETYVIKVATSVLSGLFPTDTITG